MKKSFLSLVTVLSFLVVTALNAQNTQSAPQTPVSIDVTHAQFLGTTPPLRNLVPLSSTTPERREMAEDRKRTVPNFIGRRPYERNPDALPNGVDPVRQSSVNHSAQIPVEPLVNIEGMNQNNANGVNPPDPCGDIGSDHYVQMVNATLFKVFDKEGNAVSGNISANTIWSQVGFSSAGDPIILYDQEVNRWIITEFPPNNFLLVAISEDSDPMGSWNAYAFSTPSFPDYPKYSLWTNAITVTTNEQGAGTLHAYFLDREALLNGDANPAIVRIGLPGVSGGPGFLTATPVDWTGATPPPADAKPIFLRVSDDGWGGISEDGVTVFEVDVDFDTPGNTTFTETLVPTAPFDMNACAAPGAGFSCIPQLGGGGIDGIPDLVMHQAHYRNFGSYEVMIMNFLVNADGSPIRAGIRWVEMRRQPGGEWEVYQEGTFAPDDGIHRFMGGICMDGSGNIGLAYSFSSPDIHAGLAFTGRRSSDPLGEMTVDEYVITEGFSTNQGSRYGDYAQMTVDPSDDRTFWYTGEYRRPNNWGTKIFAFQLGRDTNDIGPVAMNSPLNSPDLTANETVELVVKNFGVDTQTVFDVGYVFENGTPVTESVNFTLVPDSFYTHTFTPTVDMSAVGDYEFTLFTSLPDGDDAPLNDTLRLVRSKLPRFDAGVSDIAGLDGLSCADELEAQVILTNFGTETLTSVTIEITLNGSLLETINWTGSLAPGESIPVDILVVGFISGTNEIVAATSMPNGEVDEVMVNDSFTREFDALTGGVTVSLLLMTDNWPEETTWILEDEDGDVIFEGGPYGSELTLFTEEWCLDPEGCYEFTIFDSYGDGICCDFGNGNLSIVDANGMTLAASDGVFGTSQTLDFCATFMCMMTADIDISPESEAGASDGVIMITQENGIGPFQYSIDGGATFQASNIFEGLPSGDYDVVVLGDLDCEYIETVNVPLCALAFTVETTPETNSNSMDGEIVITASNNNGTASYSIDGGITFQSSNTFSNLGTGEYEVVVQDEAGCSATMTVMVDIETSTRDFASGQIIEVYPNPTSGVFRINVKGLDVNNPLMPVEIYNAEGKLIQVSTLGRYNGVFTGELSLVSQPSGIFYVRFVEEKIDRMVRIVKE